MKRETSQFGSVAEMLRAWRPSQAVYCIYPQVYRDSTRHFLDGFPGRVLYAVKANNHPSVIRCLHNAGVRHFDCASVTEIAQVHSLCPGATAYFMVPVSPRGDVRAAKDEHGVRHFMIDHPDGLHKLQREIDLNDSVVFARMAVSHASAVVDLSSKFGAPQEQMADLLSRIRNAGAEPALAFNVGTMVTSPDAYRHALEVALQVLEQLDFRLRLVDIGGGFPRSYPDYPTPPLDDYFKVIRELSDRLPLAEQGELLVEPGRALAAPGLSAVVEVLMRKDDRLYINDGMYGIFWELRFDAHQRYPVRVYRDGRELAAGGDLFRLYGPTCDSSDMLPGRVPLPSDVQAGDYLEFSRIGAYSLSGRTNFNGHFSDQVVEILA